MKMTAVVWVDRVGRLLVGASTIFVAGLLLLLLLKEDEALEVDEVVLDGEMEVISFP